MTILGIETSCDDTAIAVLKADKKRFKILSNLVSSQVKIHQKYGGVYPTLAKREHQKNLPIVLKKALKKAGNPRVNLIAVTAGPGLEPCLWTGINFAKDLSEKWGVPLVPVNHIEGHILVNFINQDFQKKLFPAVCLVVSGGHTQLILMKDVGSYKIIGETRDDAAGECFDKTARILGLEYPGGPAVAAKAALAGKPAVAKKADLKSKSAISIKLPRPMINQKNYDFSFSGLKTAVLYNVKERYEQVPLRSAFSRTTEGRQYIQQMCGEIQQAIIDVLIHKTFKAVKDLKAKTIILGGGVSANRELRKQLKQAIKKEVPNTKYLIPDAEYCTDNALMIAATAYFHMLKGSKSKTKKIEANSNLRLE